MYLVSCLLIIVLQFQLRSRRESLAGAETVEGEPERGGGRERERKTKRKQRKREKQKDKIKEGGREGGRENKCIDLKLQEAFTSNALCIYHSPRHEAGHAGSGQFDEAQTPYFC